MPVENPVATGTVRAIPARQIRRAAANRHIPASENPDASGISNHVDNQNLYRPPSVLSSDVCMIPERTDGSYCRVWSRSLISSSCTCFFSITAIHTTTAMDFRRTDRSGNPFLPRNRYNGCPISRYRKNPGLSDPETVTPGNLLLNFPG